MKNVSLLLMLWLGFALRLYRLGAQSLWYDETVSAILARQTISDLIAHTARDIHPPGYYLLLHGWRWLAGETEFALALFSGLFGMLLIAGVYRLGRVFLSQQIGLWSAGLVAFSPYHLWYAQEVRMYTLGAFLGLIAISCGIWGATRLQYSWRAWIGYTLAATLGLYTLYYFAFLLIPLNLALLAILLKAPPKSLRIWLGTNIVILLLYLPWLPIAWRQATNPPVPPWRSDIPLLMVLQGSWTALSFGESVQMAQVWPLLILIGLLCGLGLLALPTRWRWLLPTLVFGPLAIIYLAPRLGLTGPLYHVRYIFTYVTPFYLILGAGLTWLWQRQRLATVIIAFGLGGGFGFSITQFHTAPAYASDDLRGAVAFMAQKWRPGDAILINAGYTYTAWQYYAPPIPAHYMRLTDFSVQSPDEQALGWQSQQPVVLQTGTVDGPPSLGWGDPASDFYAMSQADTIAALEQVMQAHPRLWMLRLYDTVSDPDGVVRQWLSENTIPIEDQLFAGPAYLRVQGFMSRHPFTPPQAVNIALEDQFVLRGLTPPQTHYRPGEVIDVALWWQKQAEASEAVPYALSLKLWDSQGNLAAQTEPDEWPAGSLYLTPAWPADQLVRYPLQLALPDAMTADQYWLNVVFYNTQTGHPLTVTETGEANILLGGIMIVE